MELRPSDNTKNSGNYKDLCKTTHNTPTIIIIDVTPAVPLWNATDKDITTRYFVHLTIFSITSFNIT